MVAVIIGSTGLVGHLTLLQLLESPRFTEVISVSRRPVGLSHLKLKEVLISDLSQILENEARLQGDVYFCCLGTTIKAAGSQDNFRKVDFNAVRDFAQIAQKRKAQSLVLISAAGADAGSVIFYNRVKGETENALRQMGLQRLVIFRPGLLMGERQEHRPGEKFAMGVMNLLKQVLPTNLEKRIATSAAVLATRAVDEALIAQPGTYVIEAKAI